MTRLLALLLFLAAPAQALTIITECEGGVGTVEDAVMSAVNSDNSYMIAVGSFRGAKTDEDVAVYAAERNRDVMTTFSGRAAKGGAFSSPVKIELELEQLCVGDSCLPRTDGTPYLVFLRKSSAGWAMHLGEFGCTPHFFERPNEALKTRALNCLKAGGC